MGFNVITKLDNVEWNRTTTYKCSNCDYIILKTPAIKIDDRYEINWNNISPRCACGEQLLRPITIMTPIIDEVKQSL